MQRNRNIVQFSQICLILLVFLVAPQLNGQSDKEIRTLEIGMKAPDFDLPGIDDRNYSLSDFDNFKFLVIIFTCNHCPTAQSYEDRIVALVNNYKEKGIGFVGISPNDPLSLRLDELGYSDLGDELDDMKIRAKEKGFDFPYLYDGDTQNASRAYGPVATPHIFIFDADRTLQYTGRIDDSEEGVTEDTRHDLRNALDELLAGKPVSVKTTKTFGCSVKWADLREAVNKTNEEISKEKVVLEYITLDEVTTLVKNNSGKLRLINIWATWCGPCVSEFSEFVTINRMYRRRSFEFVSISLDNPNQYEKVLGFLKEKEASGQNFIYNAKNKYDLIEAVDENWPGALPYTILVKPGGEIVFSRQGEIDPIEMRRAIVKIIGREKDW